MTILSTIMGVETNGGRNITQGNIGDINNATGNLAQGYYQIITPTWNKYGGSATGYASALSAPYSTQVDIAKNIPVNQWGPNTINALAAQGYTAQRGETLGQMMSRYGESPSATTAADGSSYSTGYYSGISSEQPGDTAYGAPQSSNMQYASDTGVYGSGTAIEQSGSAAGGSGLTNAGAGTPVNLTDATAIGAQAANTIASATGSLSSALTADLGTAIGSGGNLFVRSGFVLFGLTLLLGAFMFFCLEGKPARA